MRSVLISIALSLLLAACSAPADKSARVVDDRDMIAKLMADQVPINRDAVPKPHPMSFSQPISSLDVVFAPQMLRLDPKEEQKIVAFAKIAVEHTIGEIIIESHADEGGPIEYQIASADRRARLVKDLLVAHGASEHKISTRAFPSATWTKTAECGNKDESRSKSSKCNDQGSTVNIAIHTPTK